MGGHRVFRRTACAVAVAAIFTPSSALPAAVNWTDGTGFWDAAANWSSNPLLPGAGDDVTVNVAGLNTITYRTGTTTVDIRITPLSIYALFTEPVTTPTTPTETVTTAPPATPTTPTAPPAEGLPMTMILAIFAVIAIVVVAGYFLMMRK